MTSDDDEAGGEDAVAAALDEGIQKGKTVKGAVVKLVAENKGLKKARPAKSPAMGGEKDFVDDKGRWVRGDPPTLTELPEGAPVRALGTYDSTLFFLDAHSQLRELKAKDLSRTMILHLFGKHTDYIYRLWPTLKPDADKMVWEITGWNGSMAQEALMGACAQQGIWRPEDMVRGRGCWRVSDGRIVIHAGSHLHFSNATRSLPGVIDKHVYPAAAKTLAPADPGDDATGLVEAGALFAKLQTWNFKRDYDARLVLGWIVSSIMGGALKVRPLAWITGDQGTGKSSLMGEEGLIHCVLDGWILTTANTTAAGLYQKIRYDSLPVAIDEIEAKRGNEKTEAVIELARQAYSGGVVLRGGADHTGKEFTARCSMLFGSILIPPLMPQDVSRMALLNLDPLPSDAAPLVIDKDELRNIGRALMRRILSRFHEWDARLKAWHDFLQGMGHSARAADQFGTMLAAADLAMTDAFPDEEGMLAIAGDMAPMLMTETQQETSNATRCISYVMSRAIPGLRGGEQMLVAELIACAVRRFGGEMERPVQPLDALRFLERSGVSVVLAQYDKPQGPITITKPSKCNPRQLNEWVDRGLVGDEGVFVAFAPDGDGILELFRGSDWEGVAGARNPYLQALERVANARRAPHPIRIGVRSCRPVLIPIMDCVDLPTKLEAETAPET